MVNPFLQPPDSVLEWPRADMTPVGQGSADSFV